MLDGKTILIIGGGAGIGLAVARQASANGALVNIASRSAAARAGGSADFQGTAIQAHDFDITRSEDHGRLLERVGGIDHLVIAVRPDAMKPAPFAEMDLAEAEQAFATKFWGACRLIQAARGNMRDNGSITLTSGIAGEKIFPGAMCMAIINSATETLCRALAVDLAPLRVNAVSPGFVEPKPAEIREQAGRFPLARLASVDEVAGAYLALMVNTYQTGSVVKVDGGARLI